MARTVQRGRRKAVRAEVIGLVCLLGLLAGMGRVGKVAAQPSPAPAAVASPGSIRLTVVRAPGAGACPGAEFFDNHVTTLVGGPGRLFSDDARARLVVTLSRDAGQDAHEGRAELYDEDGTRVYERELGPVRDCHILVTALAVAFATQWKQVTGRVHKEPGGGAPVAAPPSVEAPPAKPPPPVAPTPAPSSAPQTSPPPGALPVCKLSIGGYCVLMDIYSFSLTAGALFTANYTADVGPGVYVGAEIRPTERFSFELQARGILPSRIVVGEPIDPTQPHYEPVIQTDLSNVSMLLVPCYRYSLFMGCGVAQLGVTVFNKPDYPITGQSIALGPRLGVEIPFLERFAVRVWGDALFHVPPVTYALDNLNLKWVESPVVGLFGAGLVVSFK